MNKNRKGLRSSEVVAIYPELTGSEGVLANWRNQKRGPKFYMVGRIPIYRPEDIEDYLFSNPVQTIDSVKNSN